jgi:hypothetical protein
LILVASSEAARSKWVAKEADWWLTNRQPDEVQIVLAQGELVWADGRFTIGSALPAVLKDVFAREPLWVDLTHLAADGREGWERDERFLGAIATISAGLRGIPKDQLFGEDLRRHRQTRRIIGITIATISAFLVLAVAGAVVALDQRNTARTRLAEAQRNESRALAALAREPIREGDGITGMLIALRGLPSINPDGTLSRPLVDRAVQSLADGWFHRAELAVIGESSSPVLSAAFSPDGTRIVSADFDGTVR